MGKGSQADSTNRGDKTEDTLRVRGIRCRSAGALGKGGKGTRGNNSKGPKRNQGQTSSSRKDPEGRGSMIEIRRT